MTGITFVGADKARPQCDVLRTLDDPMLRAVVICPSNPYLSIDPMLALPGLQSAITECRAPVVAVSPLVGGRAVKGPTAKIMAELGVPATIASIAEHYRGLIDGLVLDHADAAQADDLDLPTSVAKTVMTTLEDRIGLAAAVLDFAAQIDARAADAPRAMTEVAS